MASTDGHEATTRAATDHGEEDGITSQVQSEFSRVGDGRTVHRPEKRCYPVGIRGDMDQLEVSIVDGHCPGLKSLEDMRRFGSRRNVKDFGCTDAR